MAGRIKANNAIIIKKGENIVDLVDVLYQLDRKLSELEKEREEKIKSINKVYNIKIEEYKSALRVNKEMNTVCLQCRGRKEVSYIDAAGDTDWDICKRCSGTGLEPK